MGTHPNEQLIHAFYTSFQRRDAAGMTACYHPQVVFSDPVFVNLRGERAVAMWQMLCARGQDLDVTFSNVRADDQRGSAHWEARYTFSKTGRQVHNVIDAAFVFQDGQIIQHTDTFNLWRWARLALGPTGLLLGWTPFVQAAIRKEAVAGLERFVQKHT
jgi:ketosteroid isomerase-like protein